MNPSAACSMGSAHRVLRRRAPRLLAAIARAAAISVLGCGAVTPSESSADSEARSKDSAPDDEAGVPLPTVQTADAFMAPDTCKPAAGTTGSPQTILQLVDLINGLPHPVTLQCLLRSLDRPLGLVATRNLISAQPALGPDDPRVFVVSGQLSMSIVTDGDYRAYLELGEYTADAQRSIKGELLFPIAAPLEYRAPFARLLTESETATRCRICHYPEQPVTLYDFEGAFESIAYRPYPQYDLTLQHVQQLYEVCDFEQQPERCATLSALFGHGDVVSGAFPQAMPLFF